MMSWNNFEFYNSSFLWLLSLIPIVAMWYFLMRKKDAATLTMPSVKGFESTSLLSKFKPFLSVLRLFALTAVIIALARPRNVSVSKKTKSNKGIDIVMAIDVSASMLAKDLKPNRLEALKKVAVNFVDRRPNDRIGIVVYAGESLRKLQSPVIKES